jgi:hypothetical protein
VETLKKARNFDPKLKFFLHGNDKTVVVDRPDEISVEYPTDLSDTACGEKWELPFFHRAVEILSTFSMGLTGAKIGELSGFWENFDEFHKLSQSKLCKTSFFHTVFHKLWKSIWKTHRVCVESVENPWEKTEFSTWGLGVSRVSFP